MPTVRIGGGRFFGWRDDAPEPPPTPLVIGSDIAMTRPTAPADGVQIVNGKRFRAIKGEPLMEGAEFVANDAAAPEAETASGGKQRKTAQAKGPAETTAAAGPEEQGA